MRATRHRIFLLFFSFCSDFFRTVHFYIILTKTAWKEENYFCAEARWKLAMKTIQQGIQHFLNLLVWRELETVSVSSRTSLSEKLIFFFLHRKRRLLTVRQLSIFLLKFFVLVRRAVLGDAQMPENPTPLLSLQMRFWCWKIKGNNKVRPGRTTENFTQEHFTDPEFLKLLHTQFYWLPCKHNPDQVREKCKQKLCI